MTRPRFVLIFLNLKKIIKKILEELQILQKQYLVLVLVAIPTYHVSASLRTCVSEGALDWYQI